MGYTDYSADLYNHKATLRAKTATPVFAYSAAVSSGKVAAATHDSLNPTKFTNKVRESRDSAEYPNSLAIAVAFDVTGSMGGVPKTVQTKLNTLMSLLLKKGYVEDPHIMPAAFGDSYCDYGPLQVGQFEAGNEVEDHLTNIWLEGGGGGQVSESPGLFLYYMANYTSIDCFEKRGKKGYIFIITDEKSHSVSKEHIKEFIGVESERDYSFQEVLDMARTKYNIFVIMPNLTCHYNDSQVNNFWKSHLGENFLKLDDPDTVAELIASTIGLCEGNVDNDQLVDDLNDAGLSKTSVDSVTKTLSTVSSANTAISNKKYSGTGLKPL